MPLARGSDEARRFVSLRRGQIHRRVAHSLSLPAVLLLDLPDPRRARTAALAGFGGRGYGRLPRNAGGDVKITAGGGGQWRIEPGARRSLGPPAPGAAPPPRPLPPARTAPAIPSSPHAVTADQ